VSLTNTEVTADLEPCGRSDHPDCGIRDVLDRVGDTWSVLVVVELASGDRRFRELQRATDGISQRMLTLTVRRLERSHGKARVREEYESIRDAFAGRREAAA
jgi:DNA-binding HxlR family transcriptional regulator